MNRIRFIMVLCLSLCCCSLAFGQSRPQKAAEQFFNKKLLENGIHPDFRFDEPIRYGNIWIFECRYPEGFVLVRESDSCRIVGYSTRNRFTRNNKIPAPALTFVESLSRYTEADIKPSRLKTKYNPIGPLIRTTWSQEGFFNYFCPEDPIGPDNHVYAGCAAVAMGQIIRYFGKFNDFQLTVVNEDYRYGTLTATIGNYDWNRMENRPITIDTEVSEFLFGLGVLTRMSFGPSGSSTSNYNVYDGFKKLKYYSAIRMIRSSTTAEVWIKNFYQNMVDFQPVYVSGSGHSFICDGIDAEGMFHFNLGWYGYADGYYPLNGILTITPSEAIFNLKPYSNNLPPVNLTLDTLSGQKLLKWEKHRLATIDPVLYRVYLNDSTYYETSKTVLNTSYFPAGNHELMVTAVYPQGESSWIGPIQLPIEGDPIDFQDNALKMAIREELIRENITPVNDSPTINQLLKLQKLEIRHPLSSLSGLEYCHNIQILTITLDEPARLNLGPVSLLKRLKWLELKNIDSKTLELLTHNDRLIHLDLTRCPASNFDFLLGLTGLLSLQLYDLPVSDTRIFSNLLSIKQLTLSGCNLSYAGFIQNMTNLEYIDLSRNQLQRIRLNDKLPELHELNISRNQINELFFLEYIPNIQRLNLGHNQINRFITGLNFKYIQELNLDNNSIDSLWIGVPMPTLTKLTLNGNKIRTISLLKDFAPGLTSLDLADNFIQHFWEGSLQLLEYLDLSNNRINLLNDLTANPSLRHIDLSYNQLADLYPVFNHSNGNNIQYLDLTGNPLSIESTEEFAPFLRTAIDTLLLPDYPQEFSPGNPQPLRNQSLTGQTGELSWLTNRLPVNSYYEVYTGLSPDSLTFTGHVASSYFQVDITPGQHYFWRVRTILPDTSFFSGLFNFVTYQPFTLPFKEDFESYPPFGFFSELSDCWIKATNGSTVITDGRIDPYRRSEGKQSLKLTNASDLRLPMSHLYQSILYISMQLLIDDGCIASVRLNDINGANLELYFKSNERCDILINNQLRSEVPYRASKWFPLQINLYSKGNEIWVKLGDTDIPITWVFTGKIVHLGEIEFASAPGPNWPYGGQPLFHVDDIEIKASGSLKTESFPINQEILVYPNPADQMVYIERPAQTDTPDIRIFDFSGRMIQPDLTDEGQDRWKVNVMNLVPGIYLVRVTSGGASQFAKICISRQ
ncbi:MAG: T9SS C-terminal target domain-containing protein [Porphyromonadaceae bacterium]|nr:MAG: T9SS C-terminal target domain-containing protein [Porphyromonadaceae bacterium]